MSSYFSDLSIKLTNKLSKDEKKDQGIYFTPSSIVTHFVDETLLHFDDQPEHVLEPSCGSCEIVNCIDKKLVNSNIVCIEHNKTIYDEIINLEFENDITIINMDFIKYSDDTNKYDLIIGNPPYFVCKKDDIPKEYSNYIVGRPNIFGLFILHSLSKLKVNGILAFIIPKSFLNSSYYAPIRNYIKQTCDILNIIDYEDNKHFLETAQSTFGLIIQKKTTNLSIHHLLVSDCDYSLKINENFIFTTNSHSLKQFFEYSTTLKDMGLLVKTGPIVWNEKKNILTEDDKATILIYNTNITNSNKLQLTTFKNDTKKQYIDIKGSTSPIIVVNRGNGNSNYNFKYSLINIDKPYVVENHLNIIYPSVPMDQDKLLELYSKVIQSFKQKKTTDFIKLFFGNNGLSKTELETVLPIYL